ncbi:hypothetical protein ENUP19_0140G0001 [Entamoeba nuttalli]|uniref:Sulphate adenylyltransferase catalytic domain-containing protein n=1 Tax=Entamoeba nuttalli TaxID=412467 RepID=A0ABQ0DK90_9EUKA
MASLRTCPHTKKDRVIVSGTMVRKMLSEGKALPDHFGRAESLKILADYYQHLDKSKRVTIKLQKFATGDAMEISVFINSTLSLILFIWFLVLK